jgi:hypothetical protein
MTPRERVRRIEQECAGVWASYGVTAWEREFLASIARLSALSEPQDKILADVEEKVFGAASDDDEEAEHEPA